jgi:Flp pilus assembly protein TadD
LNLGSALGNAKHPNEALAEFQIFVREQPNFYLGHVHLGRVLHEADRFAESAREFERAVELEPRAVEAWGKLGVTYEKLGERDKAISAYQRVLALVPEQPIAQKRLAVLKSRMTVEVLPK